MKFTADEGKTFTVLTLGSEVVGCTQPDTAKTWTDGSMEDRFKLLLSIYQPAYVYQSGRPYREGERMSRALTKLRGEMDESTAVKLYNENVRKRIGKGSAPEFLWEGT